MSINKNNSKVVCWCIGYYVMGVLFVFWSICDNKFMFVSRKVVVCYVDSNFLFMFRLKIVYKKSKVNFFVGSVYFFVVFSDSCKLVFINYFRIVK